MNTIIIRMTVAAAFLLGFLAIGVLAARTHTAVAALVFVEAIALGMVAILVGCELRPALAELRLARAGGAHQLAIVELRRALDELPETPHPLGL
jgi:hypothetical protein